MTTSSKQKGKTATKSNKKKKIQPLIYTRGIKKLDPCIQYLQENVLLTTAIYGNKIPEEYVGHEFQYNVIAVNSEAGTFSLRYQNIMILEEGIHWIENDGGREILTGVSVGSVHDGQELYRKAVGRIKSHEKNCVSVAKATLKQSAS